MPTVGRYTTLEAENSALIKIAAWGEGKTKGVNRTPAKYLAIIKAMSAWRCQIHGNK
jgi:hypothetical protein